MVEIINTTDKLWSERRDAYEVFVAGVKVTDGTCTTNFAASFSDAVDGQLVIRATYWNSFTGTKKRFEIAGRIGIGLLYWLVWLMSLAGSSDPYWQKEERQIEEANRTIDELLNGYKEFEIEF